MIHQNVRKVIGLPNLKCLMLTKLLTSLSILFEDNHIKILDSMCSMWEWWFNKTRGVAK